MLSAFTRRLVLPLIALLAVAALADTVTMTSGREVEGVVLREDERSVVVALDYGTITYPRSHVRSVKKDAKPAVPPPAQAAKGPAVAERRAQNRPRIPTWIEAVKVLTAQPWATGFRQIPATVIDASVMKNVPYQSFRCGSDYEVNVYGDPDAPAAIEIGVYRGLLKDKAAKENCVGFIALILGDPIDAGILRLLDRRQDLVERKGLSIEITPETAEDAYGGWWVSVYDEEKLDKARASKEEIEEISVAREEAAESLEELEQQPKAREPVTQARRPATARPAETARRAPVATRDDRADELWRWSQTEMRESRPPRTTEPDAGAGRVYVRGYYRKDGTYVRAHTRRSRR